MVAIRAAVKAESNHSPQVNELNATAEVEVLIRRRERPKFHLHKLAQSQRDINLSVYILLWHYVVKLDLRQRYLCLPIKIANWNVRDLNEEIAFIR